MNGSALNNFFLKETGRLPFLLIEVTHWNFCVHRINMINRFMPIAGRSKCFESITLKGLSCTLSKSYISVIFLKKPNIKSSLCTGQESYWETNFPFSSKMCYFTKEAAEEHWLKVQIFFLIHDLKDICAWTPILYSSHV